ncbi:MAG: hypothetical protein QOD57_2144, partial [Actinomycetota bacterium]|nr:hypothetical protein [Actinomycetota bacterium]
LECIAVDLQWTRHIARVFDPHGHRTGFVLPGAVSGGGVGGR